MNLERSSGILMHITSLPSSFGIGDIGPAAYDFIDFLSASGFSYWQILPLNPIEKKYHYSPYSSCSAFAGNPLLISPELLEQDSLIRLSDISIAVPASGKRVSFGQVEKFKAAVLSAAFQTFRQQKNKSSYLRFCNTQRAWLEPYSLYKCLVRKYGEPWTSWPIGLRDREPLALKKSGTALKDQMEFEKFQQFLFFEQWKRLKGYARDKDVKIIGDLPFYISHESVECWVFPSYFKLDTLGRPLKVSGVPPDLFSEEGQLWGTPVFHWKEMEASGFQWWRKRIKWNLSLFDGVRLDHFRGFSAYWEVAAKEKTAQKGSWVKVPGRQFFQMLQQDFPDMPFIAEDLGSLDRPVFDLIEEFDFPGMRVLQFAFEEPMAENPYTPHNHSKNSVIYTGTHDNNTSRGWFRDLGRKERGNLNLYTGRKVSYRNVHSLLIRLALSSVGKLCILPMQDVLGLGSAGRMNLPGTTGANWTWRMEKDQLSKYATEELRELNAIYGRIPWI